MSKTIDIYDNIYFIEKYAKNFSLYLGQIETIIKIKDIKLIVKKEEKGGDYK